MRMLKSVAILASVMAMFAVGCSRTPLNVPSAPVVTQKPNPTPDEIAKAIVRAGVNTNWRITEQGPGQLLGFRSQGPHSASISISYSPQSYAITLKESTMGDAERIHKTYNRWVQELEMQIRSQLSAL
jgi:hypothetical protein